MINQVRAPPPHPPTPPPVSPHLSFCVYLRNEWRLWLPGGSGDSVAQWQQCALVGCQETRSHPSLVSSVFPDGRVMGGGCGGGALMKGHVPQGDTHSATRLSLRLQNLRLAALTGDTCASPGSVIPARSRGLMSLTTARVRKVNTGSFESGYVDTWFFFFFERKLLDSDICLPKKKKKGKP